MKSEKLPIPLDVLCEQIARETGVNPATVRFCARMIFGRIRDVLQEQTPVLVPGFGRFDFRKRKEHVSHNVNSTIPTYTPANSALHFTPDRGWACWQMTHSAELPEELPAGTQLGRRFATSHHIRQLLGDKAPTIQRSQAEQSFFDNVIVARAKKKEV